MPFLTGRRKEAARRAYCISTTAEQAATFEAGRDCSARRVCQETSYESAEGEKQKNTKEGGTNQNSFSLLNNKVILQ